MSASRSSSTTSPATTPPVFGMLTQPVSVTTSAASAAVTGPRLRIVGLLQSGRGIRRQFEGRTGELGPALARQREPEARALARRRPHLEPAAVQGGVLERDRQ